MAEVNLSDATADLPPGAELLGREWLGFDDTGETGLLRFEARLSFTNRHGTIQGGFLAAMLDSATGIRALASLPSNQTVVTRSLDTRFLKPASVGPISARARIVKQTDHEMIVEAELTDVQGVAVASATARLRILQKK
jgi:uncharacterized protein (TIGR00369 family)